MAKKIYAPVATGGGSLSKEITSIYAPVKSGNQSLSKKIIKGYASVGGVSKQVFGASSGGYEGVRLVFDYAYESGQTYTLNRASIIDTIKYFINKQCLITKGTTGEACAQALKTNIDEVVAYVNNYLISSDNTIYINISSYSSSSLKINCYIGQSTASTLTASNWYLGSIYPKLFWNTASASANSRIYIGLTGNSNGTIQKEYQAYTGAGIITIIGQEELYTSAYEYLYSLSNLGVHFTNFSTGNVVLNVDYTQSGFDTVDGINGMLGQSLENIDSSGLHKESYVLEFPGWLLRYGNAAEIQLGTITVPSQDFILIKFGGNDSVGMGLGYSVSRSTWSLIKGSNYEDLNISDPYYFANATAKMSYDSNGVIKIYKNGSLVYTANMTYTHTINDRIYFANNLSGIVKKIKVISDNN